jgi:uncharacterized protein (TIGR00297 family)
VSIGALLAVGLILNACASLLALRRGSVDPGGAVAGTVVGTLIFGLGGPLFWLVLAVFFVTSTAAGMLRHREKEWLATIHQKGERRDLTQVLANGGVGALAVVLYRITAEPAWAAAFAVSFAASNADTWASEIGVLSRAAPRSLLSLRTVPRGISGGVTALGTLAALAGALVIGLLFGLENLELHALPGKLVRVVLVVTLGGFAGSLVDSILGATLQARFADAAGSITERRVDARGSPNTLMHGLPFVTNDVVNILSCLAASAAGFLAARLVL